MSVQIRSASTAFIWCLLAGAAGISHSAELALSNTPLFLGGNVEPNVYFLVDDSGSMDEEWIVAGGLETFLRDYKYVLPVKANGADWEGVDQFEVQSVFPTPEAFKTATGLDSLMWRLRSSSYNLMYYNPNITYQPWAGTQADGSPFPEATATAALVHPVSKDMDLDGIPESDAELTIDLTTDTGPFGNDAPIGFSELEYEDESSRYAESIFPATYYLWLDEDGDGEYGFDEGVKKEIRPEEAPFLNTATGGRADCADGNSCTYAEEIQNFANWFVYHRKRSFAALAAMASAIDNLSGVRLGIHLFNRTDPLNLPVSLTDSDEKTNALRVVHDLPLYCVSYSAGDTDAGVAYPAVRECRGTPARQGLYELGDLFESADPSPILSAAAGGACQQNFGIVVTDGYWNATNFGQNDDDSDFPAPGIDDNDSDGNTDFDDDEESGFADGVGLTLADVAMHFYERDLSDLDNIVPNSARDVPVDLSGELPPVALDDASHQRLNTYTIAFGIDGYALDPFGETAAESDTWPTAEGFEWTDVRDTSLSSTERQRTRVDDLFHAAYNGRGFFLSANEPKKLTSKLEQVLEDIADRSAKSGASVALTSGRLNERTLLFLARFDPLKWTGQLLAIPVEPDGRPSATLKFEAGCVLTGGLCPTLVACAVDADGCTESAPTTTHPGQPWDSGRKILTWRPTGGGVDGKGIKFAWPADPAAPTVNELSPEQIAFLKWNPATGASDPDAITLGRERLEFLRGNQELPDMRKRDSLLGDIVSSAPAYVAAPSFAYPDGLEPGAQAYSAFAADPVIANRTPMVYVGANDGMLHGFNASNSETDPNSGREEIAYIPSPVYRNLWRLTAKGYGTAVGHRFFVNGSPAVGDALFDDATWHTVLVGTLGQGGQGVFALDVTNPGAFGETGTGPSDTVLWEFTDTDDADLGYTYGKAHIVRLHNGQWAAILSNGYNNVDDDTTLGGQQSTTGNGVLYLLDIETGELIRKFDTGHGMAQDPEVLSRPNGLAEPTPVDIDGDRITDYIYVPDLFGNVFKIDVTGTNKTTWDFTPTGGTEKTPLYTAKDDSGKHQPITSRIEVGLHPFQPGTMIFFGTGKFIETTDGPNNDLQTFFGLWDRNNGAAIPSGNRDRLLSQEIIEELTDTFTLPEGSDAETNTEELRLSTTKLVNWATQDGWYMDLVLITESGTSTPIGERVVANPILRGNRIIFVITDPSGDPCAGGGDSWLAELSASDGARLPVSPFDLNEDGLFNFKDLAGAGEGGDVASMVKLDEITVSSPGILEDGSSGTGGSGGTVGREYKYFSGSESGQLDYLTESSGRSKGRQSWRQIWSN